jgi:uncharacterized phage infection (PIP) family protein YhgE
MFRKNEPQKTTELIAEIKGRVETCEDNIQQINEILSSLAQRGSQLSEIMSKVIEDNDNIKATLSAISINADLDPSELNETAKAISNLSGIMKNMTSNLRSDEDEDEDDEQEIPIDKQVRIISVNAKPLHSDGDDRMDYSWKVDLENLTSKYLQISLTVKFVDADGFELTSDYASTTIRPNETTTCTGREMFFDLAMAKAVEQVNASVEIN